MGSDRPRPTSNISICSVKLHKPISVNLLVLNGKITHPNLTEQNLGETQMAIKKGTALDDILNGTALDDVIKGLDGNDTIDGGAGNDVLNGDAGTTSSWVAKATIS